ncbi:aminoacyl-tRNA hydrolase [Vibrio nigripulchritudo]|uniref:alternative ribosome rescue aminoacyl-tRNA hydrolase ArfB n=1 Tax=Vibrio nigripulchritudo TaxID=28173 RepID=UPI00190BDD31|nr:alternative ribosome rescue aminoacyl-tRNA hydrolase ArfB [Vibrio nigripulchritudo]BCL69343.1 aminoacyl-tRNA hydrolase [Vibrio nigripulchritudo]BDU30678.1 aminoacyl-tRNA hydrolase [Vibrio nigripulchritudo]
MITISNSVVISPWEVQIDAIRAQGAGGQNVNKVSSAIHLRFDIQRSALPDFYKQRLLNLKDSRITKDGVIIIKAQQFRTQEQNKEDALNRLAEIVRSVAVVKKKRRETKPTFSSKMKRMDKKSQRGQTKKLRNKVTY